jgi:hypothetical protein
MRTAALRGGQRTFVRKFRSKWPLALTGKALAAIIFLTAGAGGGSTSLAQTALPTLGDTSELTASAERRLGDRIIRELYRDPDYIDDPVIAEYVQSIWLPKRGANSPRSWTSVLPGKSCWGVIAL